MGPFDVPASGTLDTEWGSGPADNPYRLNVALTSTQLRNLSINLSLNASDGFPYNQTDGLRQQRRRPAQRSARRRRHLDAAHDAGLDAEHAVHLQRADRSDAGRKASGRRPPSDTASACSSASTT